MTGLLIAGTASDASSCSLLSDCKIGNCARNIGNKTTVTDEWVQERNPNAIPGDRDAHGPRLEVRQRKGEQVSEELGAEYHVHPVGCV